MSSPALRETVMQQRYSLDNLHCLGTVVGNNDPKQLHRVQVRVQGIYDEVPDADLPWALPALALMMGNTSSCGTFGVPIINSVVYVIFLGGDVNIPLYFSAPYTPETKRADANINYPTRYGWIDETGNKFVVDRTSGEIFLLHKSGTQYHIADNGDITVTGVANRTTNIAVDETRTVGGNENDDVTGNVTEHVGGNVSEQVDGDKTETVNGSVNVTIGVNATIHVIGNANISVDGTTELTTTSTTINSPTTINGELVVNGNTTVSGNVGSGGSVSASGDVSDGTGSMANIRTVYNGHDHTNGTAGDGTTGTPRQPL